MGSDAHHAEEAPAHKITVRRVLDRHASRPTSISPRSSRAKTELRHQWPSARSIRASSPARRRKNLVPGSMVFVGAPPRDRSTSGGLEGAVVGVDAGEASWRRPGRPSQIVVSRRPNLPVVHVAVRGRRRLRRLGRGSTLPTRGRVGSAPRARGSTAGGGWQGPARGTGGAAGQLVARRLPVAGHTRRMRLRPAGRVVPGQRTSASTTWPATCGSGPPTGGPTATPTSASAAHRSGAATTRHQPQFRIPRRGRQGQLRSCDADKLLPPLPAGRPVAREKDGRHRGSKDHIGFRCVRRGPGP